VAYYTRAAGVLHQTREMGSFRGIYTECEAIIDTLRDELTAVVEDADSSQRHLLETLPLLLQLSTRPLDLCCLLLDRARRQWHTERVLQDKEHPLIADFVIVEPEEGEPAKGEEPEEESQQQERQVGGRGEPSPSDEGAGGDGKGAASAVTAEATEKNALADSRAALFDRRPAQAHIAKPVDAAAPAAAKKREVQGPADIAARAGRKKSAHPALLPEHPLLSFVAHGNRVVLYNLAEWVIAYQDTFLAGDGGKGAGEEDAGSTSPAAAMATQRRAAAWTPDARKQLLAVLDVLMDEYLGGVASRLYAELEAGSAPTYVLVAAVDQAFAGVLTMDALVPAAGLRSRAGELAVSFTRRLCHHRARGLQAAFALRLTETCERLVASSAAAVAAHLDGLVACVQDGAADVLEELRCIATARFADAHAYFRHEFAARTVRAGVVRALISSVIAQAAACATTPGSSLPAAMAVAGGGEDAATPVLPRPSRPNPLFLLVLSRLCVRLGADLITGLMTNASRLFPPRRDPGSPVRASVLTDADELACAEHMRSSQLTARAALAASARMVGSRAAIALRLGLAEQDWLAWPAPPAAVRPVVVTAVDGICAYGALVAALYPPAGPPKAPLDADGGGRGGQHSMLANIHKLFSDKIEVLAPVDFTHESIMAAVVRIVVKALAELVRTCTFGAGGLQQVEVSTDPPSLFSARPPAYFPHFSLYTHIDSATVVPAQRR